MGLPLPFRAYDLMLRSAVRLGRTPKEELARTVEERKALYPSAWVLGRRPRDVSSTDERAGSVPVRIYRPADPSGAGLLYLHGGGFMVGDVRACDHICADLAHASRAVVVSVDYRLAPEDPFPAALDDSAEALRWFMREAPALGVDPVRIGVGGDSAGGNLAASLCLRERATPVALQILIYPMLDLTCSRESWVSEGTPSMDRDYVVKAVRRYYGEADVRDPLVSPLFATDLAGLPPALIITAQHDALRDDGSDYAAALRGAGVPVRYLEYPCMPHAFLNYPRFTRHYADAVQAASRFLTNWGAGSLEKASAPDQGV